MSKLIKNGHAVVNEWKTLTLAEGETPESVRLPAGQVLVPSSVWRARRSELIRSEYEHGWLLGVWLGAEEDLDAIVGDIEDFSVIAIELDKFSDGKAYSTALLLRERYGYRGELRAIGDIPRNTFQLRQFGFDAFEVKAAENADHAPANQARFGSQSSPGSFPGLRVALAA